MFHSRKFAKRVNVVMWTEQKGWSSVESLPTNMALYLMKYSFLNTAIDFCCRILRKIRSLFGLDNRANIFAEFLPERKVECQQAINSYLGEISLPCCMSDPIVNHIELQRENSLTRTSCSLQGWGLSHSYGLNLTMLQLRLWSVRLGPLLSITLPV